MSGTDVQTQRPARRSASAGSLAWRLGVPLCCAAALLARLATGSPALGARATAQLSAGDLAFASAPALTPPRDGQVSLALAVDDARGSGSGWAIELAVSDLSRASRAASAATILAASAQCAPGATCRPAVPTQSYPVVATFGTPRVVFDARPGTGMGAQVVRLALPAAQAHADATFSLVSGP